MGFARVPVAKAKAKAAILDEVESLASSYEPAIANAILKALQRGSDDVDLEALAQMLASGNVGGALDLLVMHLGGIGEALEEAIWAGGAYAAAAVNAAAVSGVTFVFQRLNPVLVDYITTYTFGLIREIGASVKDAIRAQLAAGLKAGIGPRAQARQIKAIVGLTDRQAAAVANFRAELEGFHNKRTAGGWALGSKVDRRNGTQIYRPGPGGAPMDGINQRRLRDYRYDGQLARAMKDGKPLTPAQIDKMVDAYARKYRKYRAETIARTESMRALNIGIQDGWRQAIWDGKVVEERVRRLWKVAHDERTCKVCQPIPGLNEGGVGFGVPFQTPKGPTMLPPMHPDCRCHIFIKALEPGQVKI